MKYAVLDLETTGHSASDEILQAAIVIVNEQLEIESSFSSFVKPSVPIPPFITRLTGIDEAIVAEAPPIDEVLLQLIPLLDDAVLVAHNVGFDAGFLNTALDRCGYLPFTGRRLDTVELLRVLYPSLPSYQLGAAAGHFGIVHEAQHRADSDATATAELFVQSVHKLRSLPLLTLQRLSALIDESRDLGWFIKQNADWAEQHAALESNEFDYYRQFALKAGEWGEDKPPRKDSDYFASSPTFEQYMTDVTSRFQAKFEHYEERESQTTMIHEVYEALSGGRHLLIEAGTGTGKSLGYLIPSLYYGAQSESKIVVSTHTINLQEQLRQRDLPLLSEMLPFPFKASLFKGRSNYLCMRKFENKLNALDFASPFDDGLTASQMTVWLSETETGDQEELNLSGRASDFWSTVASDADSCLNRACPWFKRCYYHRAKHEANTADVCITNHAMLFTDIGAEHRLLPSYSHLIVDEAHHVEETAGKHLGTQLHYFTLIQACSLLVKDGRSGLLASLMHKLKEETDERAQVWLETIEEIIPRFQPLRDNWDKLFELLYGYVGESAEGEPGTSFRLKRGAMPSGWEHAAAAEDNVHVELADLIRKLEKTAGDIKERIDELPVQSLVTDINGALRDLARVRDELRAFIRLQGKEYVYWLETTGPNRFRSLQLCAAPIDVSGLLRQYFFDAKESVIMTSATLSVQKTFQYAAEQLGLAGFEEQGKLKTVQLASPFNYREQALVMIPRDFPVLKGASVDDTYVSLLAHSLSETASETNGRMLVLFTSYRMLKQTYEPLRELLDPKGIGLLGQGIDSGNRTKLVRRFLQQPASVLLGTSSFWEGVDIPGEALICLAIVRLPFQPPNHPVQEAKAELLQEKNQNPFMKLSIPQAVIRFKQGFGRLVRTRQDKGIVIVYDTRVIDSYYGKHFLYSLPGPKIETMHADKMVPRIREWLSSNHVKEGSN
jgi:DnaQ family exonuclease/DinG family helicase, putative